MPEMYVQVRWPDGDQQRFYPPSLVVRDFLEAGAEYPVDDFVERSREALTIASDRVREKYGFPCSRAAASLSDIEHRAGKLRADRLRDGTDAGTTVVVEALET